MTIRDIAISFGFEVDKASEGKANKAVGALKSAAEGALGELAVAFAPDAASVGAANESIAALREAAAPLESSKVGYQIDAQSEQRAKAGIRRLAGFGRQMLGALGIGFSVAAAVGAARRLMASNEEIQTAASKVREEFGGWLRELDATFGVSRNLTRAVVAGLGAVTRALRAVTDGFLRLAARVGGVDRLMRILAISAGTIYLALNGGKILAFFAAMGRSVTRVGFKVLGLAAIFVIIALLIDDLLNFLQGNDSLMGHMFERFGVDGDAVRGTIFGLMDAVRGLLPFLLELAKTLGVHLLDAAREILPRLIEMGGRIIPVIMDAIARLLPLAMEIVDEILPPLIGLFMQLAPLFMDLVKQLLPPLMDLMAALLPIAMQIIRQLLPPIINLVQRLVPVAMQIVRQVLPPIIGLIEKLVPVAMQIINAVLPVIISLIEALMPMMEKIVDAVLPLVIGLIEKFAGAIGPIVDAALPMLMSLLDALVPVITFVAELIGNVLGAAFEGLMPVIDGAIQIFGGLIDFVAGVFTGDWGRAWEGVKSIFSGIIGGLGAIFKLPLNLIIAGLNVFIRGLNRLSIPDWVPGVGGMGINIPEIPKLARGSDSSPDTFIAGEAGPELITNAKGSKVFTAGETFAIFDAFRKMAAAAAGTDAARTICDLPKLGAPPKPETVYARYGGDTTVVQNVEISNTFMGEKAAQKSAARAMEKAADDATGQMARALAYARG